MKVAWALWLVLATIVFGLSLAAGVYARRWQNAAGLAPESAARDHSRGAILYTMHCAKCHGPEGRGDAEGSDKLTPPPRDFTSRPWRHAPTQTSIERVIERGLPGTSMPAFGPTLLEADIEALAAHVLTLAEVDSAELGVSDPLQSAGFHALRSPRPAPQLKLENAAGERLALEDLRGKVVLLHFWGVSCPHCLARMPALAEFEQRLAEDDFLVLNICADDDDAASAQALLTQVAPSLKTYVDITGLAHGRYEVSLLPTLWLVDRQGNLIARAQGARNWGDPQLQALLERLLADGNRPGG